jgi:hypothetical protein
MSDRSWRSTRRNVQPRVEPFTVAAGEPVHAAYAEPSGWRCPARHFDTLEDALAYAAAVTWLAGLDAARRRVWHITACDCDAEVTR